MPGRPGLTRSTVVRAAAELYDAAGGGDVLLKDVARKLGVRTPSLYNHIGGQDELRHELAVYGAQQLAVWIGRAAIGKAGDDAVIAAAEAYRAFSKEHPGLYQITLHAPAPGNNALHLAAEEILHILHLILLEYRLSEAEEIHAVRGLRSLVHGFVSLELAGGFGMPVDVDESFHFLIEMYIRGLRRDSIVGATS
jgi:AcrR family transcriptional regulator